MVLSREERWGKIVYDLAADRFNAEIRNPNEELRTERPLSLTLHLDETGPAAEGSGPPLTRHEDLDREKWLPTLRQLSSWGVLRLNIARAELLERLSLQWLLETTTLLSLQVVFSIEAIPEDLELRVPSGTEVRVLIDPSMGQKYQRLLSRCIAAGLEVSVHTVIEPYRPELLRELASDLALLDIRRWTIAPPPSSAEQRWIGSTPSGIPPEVTLARQRYPWLRIEYADVTARENNLIMLPDGALFAQDPVTFERVWLGWLNEMNVHDLVVHPQFSMERHLNLWVEWIAVTEKEKEEAFSKNSIAASGPDFDVFVSYDDDDWNEIKEVVGALEELGLCLWIDKRDIPLGVSWIESLEENISRAPAMIVFIGRKGKDSSPFQALEPQVFIQRFKTQKLPLIPVILKGVEGDPVLPAYLQTFNYLDLRRSDSNPLDRLVREIKSRKLNKLAK